MKPLITDIPEDIAPNTVIETDNSAGLSCTEFLNSGSGLDKSQKEQYDYKYATLDCDRNEYYSEDEHSFMAIFLEGYMTLKEARAGHRRIISGILGRC